MDLLLEVIPLGKKLVLKCYTSYNSIYSIFLSRKKIYPNKRISFQSCEEVGTREKWAWPQWSSNGSSLVSTIWTSIIDHDIVVQSGKMLTLGKARWKVYRIATWLLFNSNHLDIESLIQIKVESWPQLWWWRQSGQAAWEADEEKAEKWSQGAVVASSLFSTRVTASPRMLSGLWRTASLSLLLLAQWKQAQGTSPPNVHHYQGFLCPDLWTSWGKANRLVRAQLSHSLRLSLEKLHKDFFI